MKLVLCIVILGILPCHSSRQGAGAVTLALRLGCDLCTTCQTAKSIYRATSCGGCGQVSRSKSVANRFLNMFCHIRSYDQHATYEQSVKQPNRTGSRTSHATSRGGCGQIKNRFVIMFKNLLLRSEIVHRYYIVIR